MALIGSGRKIEARPSSINVGISDSKFGSSLIPLRIEGMTKNILIDKEGVYYGDGHLLRLLGSAKDDSTNDSLKKSTEDKVQRINFVKSEAANRRNKKSYKN